MPLGRVSRWIKPRLQDLAMRAMNEYRPAIVAQAEGDVLEIGFGTGLNLPYYTPAVKSLVAVDPLEALPSSVHERIARAGFPVHHYALCADGDLPLDAGRFDCVLFTWTLCSIPDPMRALMEMRRVLKSQGKLLFAEHGRSESPDTARWQDRLNPIWVRLSGGCNMNRPIAELVQRGGFALTHLERFRGRGPRVLAEMYRGVAAPSN